MVPACTCGNATGRLHHQQVDLARDEIDHGRTGTAVGHELEARSGRLLQQNAAHGAAAFWFTNMPLPGLAFIQATRPLRSLAASALLGDHQLRIDGDQAIGAKSFSRS